MQSRSVEPHRTIGIESKFKNLPRILTGPKSPINDLQVIDYIYEKVTDLSIEKNRDRSMTPIFKNFTHRDILLRGSEKKFDISVKNYKLNDDILIFKNIQSPTKPYLLPSITFENTTKHLQSERINNFLSSNRTNMFKHRLIRRDFNSPDKLIKRREKKYEKITDALNKYSLTESSQKLRNSIENNSKFGKELSSRMK